MRTNPNSQPCTEHLLRTYFHAKDENRPHLMAQVFCEDAQLDMQVNSDAISFPAATRGLAAIADVLVRKFDQAYENVYSFYLQRPASGVRAEQFSCDWLVVMSDKESGKARVGCGRYDWTFQTEAPFLASRLQIRIETMQVFAADTLPGVLEWAAGLPYPWCTGEIAAAGAPRIGGLEVVTEYLASR